MTHSKAVLAVLAVLLAGPAAQAASPRPKPMARSSAEADAGAPGPASPAAASADGRRDGAARETVAGPGETLAAVRRAGALRCGVVIDVDDYSEADTHGDLSALGADFCRALAAETLGDPGKARFLSLPDEPGGLAALRDGRVDVLFGATPHPVVGGIYGVAFGPPMFFDGQGFLVARDSGIATPADLGGRNVCFINASPPERGLYDALEPRLRVPEARFPFSERGEMEAALVGGHCDAITGDISWMANVRSAFHAQVARFTVLPDTISLDPMSPAYRVGDATWASLVDWTVWALLQAEEHGVTQANAEDMRRSADPVVQRLTGELPWIAKSLGVSEDAFRLAIEAVGNYGEIYERDVGAASALALPRGRNALASRGGLMWALPVEPLQ
jgi:general L-amino acid transport system substrate-binding protein